ncbi:MAG: hypothetical protein LBV47_02135 [Bacteroidales bacterium]|jgi:hypothetical protein|nr:hypothetical protein [Bacteroidales bacterium]
MNLNPIKLVIGPDALKPTYRLDGGGNQIVFDRTVPYAYRNYYIDNNYFYLSYIGDYFTIDTQLKNFKSWIFKFDWDGNFIESFHSPEYISAISKSSNNDIFYGRGFDKDGTTVLWKLSIVVG